MTFDFEQSHNVTDAVIYCRVSSKKQVARGDGLNSQETRCRAYADYKDYNVKEVFKDDLTGKTSKRKGLNDLIAFLRSDRRNPHVVIVDDLTRFARKVRVHFDFKDAITEAGGILESPTLVLRDDADGELHEYILASVSQHQSRKNAEQVRNRTIARIMNGYCVLSRPPKGYKYQTIKGRGKVLVRDEPLASIITEALEAFACGRYETHTEVLRYFESQPAFPKDLPNGKIHYDRVTYILKQPLYAGYIESHAYGVSFRKAQHEGLISLQTFEKIQNRLKDGARAPARKDIGTDFVLRNFVLCGDCEKPLTACWSQSSTGKKHPYYICKHRNDNGEKCLSYGKSIRRDQIEGEFEEILKAMKPSETGFNMAKAMMNDAWNQRLNQLNENTIKLKRDLKAVEKKTSEFLERIVATDNLTVIKTYENKITALEKEKLLIGEKLAKKEQPKHSFDDIFELSMQFLGNPHRIWGSGHIHLQRLVLRLGFSERITYHRENGFSNVKKPLPFNMLDGFLGQEKGMVGRARFERATT